jgi:hypothetical protein
MCKNCRARRGTTKESLRGECKSTGSWLVDRFDCLLLFHISIRRSMKRTRRIVLAMCVLSPLGFAQVGQTLPRIEGTTLNHQKMVLPDASRHALVLVFGFSRKSADQTEAWEKRISKDYSTQTAVGYFEIPELQGVPEFVKSTILHGMRKEVPASEHSHFAPIYEHEQELKKLVGFSKDEDAYVVLANSTGQIVWQTHGAVTDANYAELVHAVVCLDGRKQIEKAAD